MSVAKSETISSYLFEVSWEVCNKVGGIFTVLATKAAEMVSHYGDRYVLIGPKVWQQDHVSAPDRFIPDHECPELVAAMSHLGIDVSCGRWDIPGRPRCLLIDFSSAYKTKDVVLEELWTSYQVDSLTGGWDYVEPVLFGHTAAKVIQRFAGLYAGETEVVAQWHEWMVGSGLLHLKSVAPEISSVFTTHATIMGRSIASSGEPLEIALKSLDGSAKASALNIRAKYSLERALVVQADCLTTVSTTTADEVFAIYGRRPDVILPNALGDAFPDPGLMEKDRVARVREELFTLAETMTGEALDPQSTQLIMTSGRYEYVNKGVNMFIDALGAIARNEEPQGTWLVYVFLPSGHGGPLPSLISALQTKRRLDSPAMVTHSLDHPEEDSLLKHCRQLGLVNQQGSRVKIIFAPVYLDGKDGVFNRDYYELLAAFDLAVFPSHYEPWGYTPLESIGLGVPTVTSDLAGFGQWAAARSHLNDWATYVLPRLNRNYADSLRLLTKHLENWASLPSERKLNAREDALALASQARWANFAKFYFSAHRAAILARSKRMPLAGKHPKKMVQKRAEMQLASPQEEKNPAVAFWRPFTVKNRIPQPFANLEQLAHNLWWTWHFPAEHLFRDLDPVAWELSGHNPVKLLDTLPQETLDRAAQDPVFEERYAAVMEDFEDYLKNRQAASDPQIAYFCMEYGLHECLQLYSGGLGVLAGDHLKAASDLDLPLIAIGMAYREGYFRQRFDISGYQIHEPMQLDFSSLPMCLLRNEDGSPLQIKILFPGHKLTIGAWEVRVGSVRLLLLDTDLPQNGPVDRSITSSLYGGDREKRLKQEMVLGIGGRNLLAELGIKPRVWHLNEGHASFLVLSRAAALMQEHHLDFQSALEYCRETGVFTTHTPVPAGHDVFSEDLMRPFFSIYRHVLHISWDRIMGLGRYPDAPRNAEFSMTVLGMRGNADVNGVSQLHGEVSQRNLQPIIPGHHWREVPVGAITNGVHMPTWLAPELQTWFDRLFPNDWRMRGADDKGFWEKLRQIDRDEYRKVRMQLKRQLLSAIRMQMEGIWARHQDSPGLLNTILANLREDACIIGFARRFAPYKRATLLFRDLERLAKIVNNPKRPVIFIFAGKAHPADEMGKALIREIYQISRRPEFQGRILLLENYDMALAKFLVRGCDIWLNTPTRPLEASGTSGMKAAMNGGVNVSVLDGWWVEGYQGNNGWAIGEDRVFETPEYQDDYDSQHLYSLLEDQVLPRFFDKDITMSDAWLQTSLQAMTTSLAPFAARRMVGEYRDRYYGPGMQRALDLQANQFQAVSQNAELKRRLRQLWEHVRVLDYHLEGLQEGTLHHGDLVQLRVSLQHPKLETSELDVQCVVGLKATDGDLELLQIIHLECKEQNEEGVTTWAGEFQSRSSGSKAFGLRVVPKLPLERHGVATDLPLVHWVH